MALRESPAQLPACPGEAGLDPSDFEAAGFLDPSAAVREWAALRRSDRRRALLDASLAECWRTLSRSADPDLALRQWVRWLDLLEDRAGPDLLERARERWSNSPLFRESFLLLVGLSPYLGDNLIRDSDAFEPESWQRGRERFDSIRKRLSEACPSGENEPSSDAEFLSVLKRFQRIEEVRIAWLDEVREAPVDRITRQISWVADALTQHCLDRALRTVAGRFRVEAPSSGFTVLAMGKLGGLELNYSSDVDLTFLLADSIPEDWGIGDPELFFTKVAESVTQLLSDYSAGPPLYRVDLRLRPEGSRGKLVWTRRSSMEYYDSKGRTWERMALIRLRPIAGDLSLGRKFRRELSPFIYRKFLTEEALGDIQRLKGQIESLARTRGEEETHVKIGQGGIRDVEFIVQYFQLVYGAEYPELHEPNVFDLLESLQQRAILTADETDSLQRGYRFLRRVEHRIQMHRRLQAHVLPSDAADLRCMARGLGFPTTEAFRQRLASSRSRVRRVYRRLFENALTAAGQEAILSALLELPLDRIADEGHRFLEAVGFRDPPGALRLLRRIAGENAAIWDRAQAPRAFRRIAGALLRELSQFADPDRALTNFTACVDTLGARSVFFDLLAESPEALTKLVEVCAHSGLVVEILRNHPGLIDEALDELRTGHDRRPEDLFLEARRLAAVGDAGDLTDTRGFQEFKALRLLVTAFRDLERRDNLRTTMSNLAQIAAAIVVGVLERAEAIAAAKLGRPREARGEAPAFLVLALGKFGGEEMNYRSDLDLVFLYQGNGTTDRGNSCGEFFTRMAQEFYGLLNKAGTLGPLWEADLRLRPMGNSNPLAVSVDEWKRYFTEGDARTWERQAFLRARHVAGDTSLAAMARRFIRETMPLRADEDAGAIRAEIRVMRRKLEESVHKGDIKRGAGGIVDVEFVVQTLQLIHGRENPELIHANTVVGLNKLTAAGIMNSDTGSELLSAYEFLRWLETRFSLLLTPGESIGDMDAEKLRSLIQRIGYRSTGTESPEEIFLEELRYHRERNRAILERVLGE